MITFFNEQHQAHAPQFEFFRGERVACFETPARAEQVRARLLQRGHVLDRARTDSRAVLAQVHTARHLKFFEHVWRDWLALSPGNESLQPFPSVWPVRSLRSDIEPADFIARLGLYSMDNGTPLSTGAWLAAKAGADAAASAAAFVAAGTSGQRAAFSCSRPPGHHAGADFMGGYCFLNNAAVAAQTLRNAGAARVAILDVDYHHGNGTQSIFYESADVLCVSLHGSPLTEYPFYLGHADESGHGAGAGFNLNLPLGAGNTSASRWFEALEMACQRIGSYQADALVVALGLDTFVDDPISRFSLLSGDFSRLGQRLGALGLPTVFVLEGGYAAAALGINAVNVIEGFEEA